MTWTTYADPTGRIAKALAGLAVAGSPADSTNPIREARKQVNHPTRVRAGGMESSERVELTEGVSNLADRWNPSTSPRFRHAVSIVALALGLAFSATSVAQAAAFTLAGPVAITGGEAGNPGVIGTLLPVAVPSSLADSISLSSGDTSFVTNDVIVFAIALSGGSSVVDEIGIGANASPMIPNPMGAGAFNAGGSDAPDSVAVGSFTTLKATFEFVVNSLVAGETTQNLFVTYSPAGSALSVGSTVNFSISSGTNFTVQTTLIPEPTTALLLGGGLVLLGLRRKSIR